MRLVIFGYGTTFSFGSPESFLLTSSVHPRQTESTYSLGASYCIRELRVVPESSLKPPVYATVYPLGPVVHHSSSHSCTFSVKPFRAPHKPHEADPALQRQLHGPSLSSSTMSLAKMMFTHIKRPNSGLFYSSTARAKSHFVMKK